MIEILSYPIQIQIPDPIQLTNKKVGMHVKVEYNVNTVVFFIYLKYEYNFSHIPGGPITPCCPFGPENIMRKISILTENKPFYIMINCKTKIGIFLLQS